MRAAAVLVLLVSCTPPDAHAKSGTQQAQQAPQQPQEVPAMRAHSGTVTIDTAAGPQRFTVELAITDPERQKGLMFREHLDDDSGMLFLFEKQKELSFWMKNTRIPLDMLFIDEGGTVAGIVENAEPLTLVSRKVAAPSRYVLELNGGAARKLGLAAGQRVHFEGVPRSLVDPRTLQ